MRVDLTSAITAAVAVYGAGLSTYVFIANTWEKRRRIKIEVANGFIPRGPQNSVRPCCSFGFLTLGIAP